MSGRGRHGKCQASAHPLRGRSVLTIALAVLLVLGTGAWTALANVIPLDPEYRVNATAADEQRAPAAAMSVGGRYLVVTWHSFGQDGSGYGVYAQRFTGNGAPDGPERPVNTTTASHQLWPAVGIAEDGRFVVAWQSTGQDPDGGTGIYARRFTASGSADGPEFPVATIGGEHANPAVGMADDGRFVIAWEGSDGDGIGVFARHYTADGAADGLAFPVNSTTVGDQRYPGVAMAGNGRFVIAWESPDGDGTGVFVQRYTDSGAGDGTQTRVNTTTAANQQRPALAAAWDGRFVVAWGSLNQDGDGWGVYARQYAVNGTAMSPELRVNTTTASHQEAPAVATTLDGRFVVTWQSYGQDGSASGIYAQRYAANGAPSDGEFRVNTTTSDDQLNPTVVFGARYLVVVWESEGQDPDDSTGIYRKRYLVNDPPTVAVSGGVLVYTEGSGAQLIDTSATVADTDSSSFDGGALTLELLAGQAEDRLAVRNQGSGSGQIGVTGSTISYGGTPIGTVSGGGSGTTPLVVALNEHATPPITQALLRNVTYQNVSQNPLTAGRTLRVTLADGDGETSVPVTRGIAVIPVNQPPTAADDTYTLGGPTLAVVAPGVLGNDTDLDSSTLTAVLVAGPRTGTLDLETDGSFTYTPAPGYSGADSFTYRAHDGAAQSEAATVALKGVASACLPRPKVETHAVAGGTRLEVTIAATPRNGLANNWLQELRFGDPTNDVAEPVNARVTVDGQVHTGRFTHTVAPGVTTLTFTIERVTPGQPTTVFLLVVDGCGTWKTFVGGGAGAGF